MIFVNNRQVMLQTILKECLGWAREVDIAVAFVRDSGVDLIRQSLSDFLNNKGKLRIVVGRDFGYTEPDALSYLQEIGSQVKVFVGDTIFHPKCYQFRDLGKMRTIIGSSNMTASGFQTGVEWNIVLKENESILTDVANSFEELWVSENTQNLSPSHLEELTRHYEKTKSVEKQQVVLQKLDLQFQDVIFPFKINKSFLNPRGYQHCITILKEYYNVIFDQLGKKKRKVVVISPDGKKVEGYIRHAISSWGPYYQLNIRKQQFDSISSEFQFGQKINVEIRVYGDLIKVLLMST